MAVNVNDPTASGMILTFDDEFDTNSTSADNVADNTLWSNHLWYDAADPGAISVSNGVLSLASNGELSSVNSAGQGFAQMYGYFEIDMKVPAGVGTWPAFWLMSQAHAQNGANPASEIDIIEGQGNQNNGYYTTLHSNTGTAGDQVNPMPNFTGNVSAAPLDSEYARFGVLWAPGSTQLTYYFDGKAVGTSNEYSTTNSSPMMVLIDNWLGDIGWGGNSPVAGQSYGPLQIDYVRVYQFAGQGATAITPEAVSPAAGQTDPTALANADGVTPGGGTTPSPNGTVLVGATGDIVTAAGNSFAITAAGQITENGTVLSITNSVTELVYLNNTLYQEATTQNLWWSYNEAAGTWTQTTNPLTAAVSPSGTVVVGTSGAIQTAAGNSFAITAGGQISENGTVMSVTNSVTELVYLNNTLYQEATTQNLWWSYNEAAGTWTATTNPLTATTGPTTIAAVAPTISVANASGAEGKAIALTIAAAQAASNLAAADLTVTIGNLNGATLNHGTLSNGVYTLHSTDLAGLTITPAANYTGTLALSVTATDTEPSSSTAASSTAQTLDVTVNPTAVAPTISVANASGAEGKAIALTIAAAQAASNLAAADLTVTIGNLNGATLNHGTLSNGVYTLHSTDLAGLTITPAANYTGTLALSVTATDTEPSSSTAASSTAQTLDVTVSPTAVAPTISVANASGAEGKTIALTIAAAQAASNLAAADLTIAVGNLNGATLNHGTETNGVYTLHSTDLAGLTITPATNYTGTLALSVTATDTEPSTSTTASSTAQTLDVTVNPTAVAPTISVANASGSEGKAIALTITAAQAASNLAAADLTIAVGNLNGATLNHGTETNGVYTLHSTDLAGLTITPATNYTGTLALSVTATDTEPSTSTTASSTAQTLDVTVNPTAVAPTISVANASGSEGKAIALTITAAQAASNLAAADLTIAVGNLNGATLNHGTLSNGVYTLHSTDLAGLTITPAANYTGTLALSVTATDTEPSTSTTASSTAHTLDVTVNPVAAVPSLSVASASGLEGNAIPLSITAAQGATGLAAADLTIAVSNLNGATLNHGTLSNGVYTLHSTDLSGLTVTPAANFTGMLVLNVQATDTEATSGTTASSASQMLDVAVNAPVVTTGGANPGGGATGTSFNPQAAGMVLTFDDEFNTASISSDGAADKTTWNSHLWYEAANPTGVTVANGLATFAPGADLSTVDASGQGFAQKYGYFEAKVNFTGGAGDVPAFWLMNAQHVTSATAPATEIDALHAQTNALTQYTTGVQSDVGQADNTSVGNTINLTSGAHTYGVLWSPNSTMLTWYLDGQEVATTAAPADLSSGAVMLNLSFEPGTGADAPVAGSNPSMQVDWVHVYQYAGQGATAVTPQANFTEPVDAVAPTLTVANASGSEGNAIALTITAAQAATDLAAADLTVTIGNLNGATLNHGTETNGVYTLHSTDLAGLTITPAANFTGTLALHVMATDTEASTGTTASDAAQTLDVTVMGPAAVAPLLSVSTASGIENSATPLYIAASQSSSLLAPADLTIAVSNLNGAALNHGTLSNGVYTLHSADLSGLTVSPAANFTGTLALHVQATDTEASSKASSVVETLNVVVGAPNTSEALMSPSYSEGTHYVYLLNSLSTGSEHIASFNPATDVLDVVPLMNLIGYEGTNPIGDHVVNLEPTANGGTAVMIDPTGTSPTHGTTVVTLDHVLPQSVPAADIWH